MTFTIENLKPTNDRREKWRFTLVMLSPDKVGFFRSHAWRYVVASDRLMRPTARGFHGNLTEVDDNTLNLIRHHVKEEIRSYDQAFSTRSAIRILKDLYEDEGSWADVFKYVKGEIEDAGGQESVAQWVALCAAACLASIEESQIPKEVTIRKAS